MKNSGKNITAPTKKKESHRKFLFLLMGLFLYSLAYCLCILSMDSPLVLRTPLINIILTINVILNSLAFPLLLIFFIFTSKKFIYHFILQLLFILVLLACSLYYQYFQTLPHFVLLKQLYLLPFVTKHIFIQLVGIKEIFCLIVFAVCLCITYLTLRKSKDAALSQRFRRNLITIYIIFFLGFVTKGTLIAALRPISSSIKFDSMTAVKQHGLIPVYVYQIGTYLTKVKKDVPWPGKINSSPKIIPVHPEAQKKNIIFVQIESFDAHFIDFNISSKYIMPHLHEIKKDGIYFNNFFAQHRGGGTTDAELTSLTSLLPLNTHSGFMTADYGRITPLNQVLKKAGYYSIAMHPTTGIYFNRILIYPQLLTFDSFLDQSAYQKPASGWNGKDQAFYEQSIQVMETIPQPFFAYLITNQSHGPYTNHSIDEKTFAFSSQLNMLQKNYILTLHEIDQAVNFLINELKRRHLFENTIVFIFGDHPSNIEWSLFEQENICPTATCRVPLLILNTQQPSEINYKVGSHTDIGPTVLDILGIDEPSNWLGSSLLQKGEGVAVLNFGAPYVLKNKNNDVVRDLNNNYYMKFIDYSISVLDSK